MLLFLRLCCCVLKDSLVCCNPYFGSTFNVDSGTLKDN